MPGSTSTFGFPYLEPSDPPDIAGATLALAQSVEDLLVDKTPVAATGELSTPTALTTSFADLPGASVTLVTARPNAIALVSWTADFQMNSSGANTASTLINVDGVDQPHNAVWNPGNVTSGRATVSNSFPIVLPSAGSHTFKMRGIVTAATIRCNNIHTQVTVLVLP